MLWAVTLAAHIDAMADAAFPPAHRAELGGWMLRADPSDHRRNRSVWARAADGDGLAARIAEVEAWYAGHGLPARFQITPASAPADLDAALEARGYAVENPSGVWVGDLERLGGPQGPVAVAERPDARWWELSGADAGVLARVEVPCAYARSEVAAARAALQGQWLGIYEVATLPEARRRGAARAILAALAGWGLERDARRAYLLVTGSNAPANALYARLGFSRAYGYCYRIAQA
jgi:ribosomal protein S18 acetylase RimI-like enzyme